MELVNGLKPLTKNNIRSGLCSLKTYCCKFSPEKKNVYVEIIEIIVLTF